MATEIPQGGASPEVLAQAMDDAPPSGFIRPHIGAALEAELVGDESAPPGTPIEGPTDGDGMFTTTAIPCGANKPLDQEQADFLNEKYGLTPPPAPAPAPAPAPEEPPAP